MEIPPDKKAQGYTSWTPLPCDLPISEKLKLHKEAMQRKKQNKVVNLLEYKLDQAFTKFLEDCIN